MTFTHLTFVEKRSRVESGRLPAIVAYLAGSSELFVACTSNRSAMPSCIPNRSREDAADVTLETSANASAAAEAAVLGAAICFTVLVT